MGLKWLTRQLNSLPAVAGRSFLAPFIAGVMQRGEMAIRQAVIDQVRLLSLASEQLAYEKSVPHANVVSELFCGFCDDLFHPKSAEWVSQFTEDELKGLAHLYGVLSEAASSDAVSVSEILKDPRWRRVIAVAKEVYTCLNASA